jgi:hypothetical protein
MVAAMAPSSELLASISVIEKLGFFASEGADQ